MEFHDNPSGGCCSAPCGTVIRVDVKLLTAFRSYFAKEPKMRPRLHPLLWLPVISKNTFSVFGKGERFFPLFTAPRPTPWITWLRNQWISGDLYPIFGVPYLYSPSGPSWPVLGHTLPVYLSPANHHFIPFIYLTICEFSSVGLTRCLINQQTRSNTVSK